MASFTDPDDQNWKNFVQFTDFEPLRLMLLTVLTDSEIQISVDGDFPMEHVANTIDPGRCMSHTWHSCRRGHA